MKTNKSGFALVTSLIIIFLLLAAISSLTFITNQSSFRVRRINREVKALSIAEAGVADSISRLSTNYLYWQNNSFTQSFAGGGYSVVNSKQTNGNVLVSSCGVFEGITRTTVEELLGTTEDLNNMLFDQNGALLCGGIISFSSAAFTILGNIHGNNTITSGSGAQNGIINGIVSAVNSIGNLQGILIPGAPSRILPSFNFDSYRTLAISGGQYYPTNKTFSGVDITPSNGIVYVNGNVILNGKCTLYGTIVASGNITVDNNFQQHTPYGNGAALLCMGSLDINNRTRWDGVLYAGGNVTLRNNMIINGCVISRGNCDIKNSVVITKLNGYPLWDPSNPLIPPEVIPGGWLK